MEIYSFPVRIISRVESTSIAIELVAEYKFHIIFTIVIRLDGIHILRRVDIYETPLVNKTGDLAEGQIGKSCREL